MDLKKLGRMPVVVAMATATATLMVLATSSVALAGPDEKGDAKRSDKKQAEQEGAQGCDGSHGSDTGHGANTDDGGAGGNEYHNTCDGTASDNGNDSGGAGGRPCAGCVGNADDKNPPGQARNGDDSNKGYECDGNNGVGGKKSSPAAGNPAHTGCRKPASDVCTVDCGPPPICPPGDAGCTPPNCPPGSSNPACVAARDLCPDGTPMPPSGRCNRPPELCPDGTPIPPDGTCVRGIIIDRDKDQDKDPSFPGDVVENLRVEAAPEEPQPAVGAGAVLPVTGGDLLPLITLALVLIAVGIVSLRRPRAGP